MPQKHVLLVDDSKSARFALRALLQKQGFSVDTAETAEIALDMLGDSKPDAIFMDHMMPGMDGFTATRAIKRDPATAHIPVVMCTSNDREEHVQEARRLGTVGILPKPPTTEKLAEILDALDREMERAAGATESGESDGSSQPQAIETALQDILPNILADTLEPVLQEKLRSHSQTMKSEVMAAVLAQQAEREQALLQQFPGTIPADWREAVLRDALHQSDTRANERHTRLSNNLDDRLAAASAPSCRVRLPRWHPAYPVTVGSSPRCKRPSPAISRRARRRYRVRKPNRPRNTPRKKSPRPRCRNRNSLSPRRLRRCTANSTGSRLAPCRPLPVCSPRFTFSSSHGSFDSTVPIRS